MSIRWLFAAAAVAWTCGAASVRAQSVYTLRVGIAGADVPAQECGVEARDSRGLQNQRGTVDSLVVLVIGPDPAAAVAAPKNIDVKFGGRWVTRIDSSKNKAIVTRSSGELANDTVKIEAGNVQVCTAVLPAVGVDDRSDPALTLHYGLELSSATGFDRQRTSPAVGLRWDIGRRVEWKGLAASFVATTDLTSAADVREHRSCRRDLTPTPPDSLPRPGEGVVRLCAKSDTVNGAVFLRRERRDSIRAKVAGTWRTFLQTRVEYELRDAGFNVGIVGGIGFQTDPRGPSISLFNNAFRQIRPIYLAGPGLRQLAADGTERFRLDVLYGTVQGFASVDRIVPSRTFGTDTLPQYAPAPIQVGDRYQWHALLHVRLFRGAHVRGFATFNAPPGRLPPRIPGTNYRPDVYDPGFPDLVRVAFLFDRDVKSVFDALVGREGAKDPGKGGTTAAQP